MNNTPKLTNQKKFSLKNFKPAIKEGTNRFLILRVDSDTIPTRNGNREVLKLDIELNDEAEPSKKMVVKNHMVFVDDTPRSVFYFFTEAVEKGLNVTGFDPEDLVGKKGSLRLSYYRPEGSDRSFERLNDWVFDFPQKQVNEQLQEYLGQDDFELTEEDINFGGPTND